MMELLYCAAVPVCQLAGLVVLGLIFRVDRKPKEHHYGNVKRSPRTGRSRMLGQIEREQKSKT
jgi:hypothetical protein